MKKSLVLLLMLALALAVFVTGCNRGSEETVTGTPTPPAQTPAPVADPTPAPVVDDSLGEIVNGVWRFHEPVVIPTLYSFNPDRIAEADVRYTWLFEWARHEMNVDIDPITHTTGTANEVFSLLMAAGDYPEAIMFFMWNLAGVSNQARWGDQEGILMPLQDFLTNPEIMPNAAAIMEEFAHEVPSLKTAEGNIYQIIQVMQHKDFIMNMTNQYFWVDTRVLDALGRTMPTTTDELLAFLLDVRDTDPMGLGSNNIPLGGRHGSFTPWGPLMNAFGFVAGNPFAMVSQYDGPFIDGPGELVALQQHPNFFAFLEFANILFTEGLLDQDFFTQEAAQSTARANQDFHAIWPAFNPNELAEGSFTYYHVIPPITSPYNSRQFIHTGATQLGGSYMVFLTEKASDLQAEAMMRFVDHLYDDEFRWASFFGPQTGVHSDYGQNLEGWSWDAYGQMILHDLDNGRFETRGDLLWAMTPLNDSGNALDRRTSGVELQFLNLEDRTGHWHNQVLNSLIPYLVRGMPAVVPPTQYVDFWSDSWSVLTTLINTGVAQFITGARPLTPEEFAAFGAELDAAGYQEHVRIHVQTLHDNFR